MIQEPALDSPPLVWRTSPDWATHALADPLALLNDHAHLERKAATNALELLNRWPRRVALRETSGAVSDRWVRALSAIAHDEARHLTQVLRLLTARGGHFERSHVNPYASALRDLVRRGRGPEELLDRLLVSALIEARSCERFELLAAAADPELSSFYQSLSQSERGHYRVFLELAQVLPDVSGMAQRWETLRQEESRIIRRCLVGPSMHSGLCIPEQGS